MKNLNNFWLKISSNELEKAIREKPLTSQLLEKTLLDYVDGIILKESEGYLLMPPYKKVKAIIFAPRKPSSTSDFETGVIHELAHLIYRTQGNFSIKNSETDLIEKILNDISSEFQKNNSNKVLLMLDDI